jgi:hypothetical protein
MASEPGLAVQAREAGACQRLGSAPGVASMHAFILALMASSGEADTKPVLR